VAEQKHTTEEAFQLCINEHVGKGNVVRVELCGIAKFACWSFVILSISAALAGLFIFSIKSGALG
jgi:hypothetical protein